MLFTGPKDAQDQSRKEDEGKRPEDRNSGKLQGRIRGQAVRDHAMLVRMPFVAEVTVDSAIPFSAVVRQRMMMHNRTQHELEDNQHNHHPNGAAARMVECC